MVSSRSILYWTVHVLGDILYEAGSIDYLKRKAWFKVSTYGKMSTEDFVHVIVLRIYNGSNGYIGSYVLFVISLYVLLT